MHRFGICVIVILSGAMNVAVRAQTPGEIGHQGILTDSLGNPVVEADIQMTFSLYDQESGGTELWTEDQLVHVEQGLFTVLLGSVNPIDLPFDQRYWLAVKVEGDELDPRIRLAASPYSRRAAMVDSVGPNAIRPGTLPADRVETEGVPVNAILSVISEDSAGWRVLGPENIPNKSIPSTKIAPAGGGTGQILSVQGDSVGWFDPPAITGAAIPNKSVRSTKLNSEDGEPNQVMLAASGDSVVWGPVGTAAIADESVTASKLSTVGAAEGQMLIVRGDSVSWAGLTELAPGSILTSKLRSTEASSGDVLQITDADTADWGPVTAASIADQTVTTQKISPEGGTNGQILTLDESQAAWRDPAGIAVRTIAYDKLSAAGGVLGEVLAVVEGDTVGWALITSANIADGSIVSADIADGTVTSTDIADGTITSDDIADDGITSADIADGAVTSADIADGGVTSADIADGSITTTDIAAGTITSGNIAEGSITTSRINTSGAGTGQVLQVTGEGAVWNPLSGTLITDQSMPTNKIDPGTTSAGKIIGYNGSTVTWVNDAMSLPFSGTVTAADTFGLRVKSPSVIEGAGFAVHGIMTSTAGGAFASAIRGENRSTSALGIGVWGSHEGGGWGVYGRSTSGRGVYGSSPDGFAGYFSGNVRVTGSIEKAGGSFKIDHPLDPENMYLLHSFVESPDMMNVYNGNVTLDASGGAVVTLPDWFEALNIDYRYQLTPIGGPGPNLYIADEIAGNAFRIAGGTPGLKVSWQVTGIRNDAWARQNRIPVEQPKEGVERGTYLHPEAFGLSPARSLEAATDQPLNER